MLETKKSIKKNHFIMRFLTKSKVDSLIVSILSEETNTVGNKSVVKSYGGVEEAGLAEALTSSPVRIVDPTKALPRIESAEQMVLFEEVEEGPGDGRTTRAVSINLTSEDLHKKDVFYIYSDTDPEKKYKEKINYSDPILLKAKCIEKGNVMSLTNGYNIEKSNDQHSLNVSFDFHEYKTKILMNAYAS